MVGTYGRNLWILYTSRDFPSGTVPRSGYLQTNWDEVLHSALTVGRPNLAYVFRHGKASYYEAVFRHSLVWMALKQGPYSGSLHRTQAYKALDPTEKGAVSYFLGMAVCKLFASHLLNTPWLLHLDVFRDELDPSVLAGRSRPDLVGEDASGAWHAFECKGRSSVPSAEDRRRAKDQARRLVRVNSTDCSLHIGAISFFRRDELEFHWRDPEPEEPEKAEPFEIQLPNDAWRHYYGPALALATELDTDHIAEDRTALDVKIEIHPEILERLKRGAWTDARLLAKEARTHVGQTRVPGGRREGTSRSVVARGSVDTPFRWLHPDSAIPASFWARRWLVVQSSARCADCQANASLITP